MIHAKTVLAEGWLVESRLDQSQLLPRRASPTRARQNCGAAFANRLVEGDEPRRDEFDVHVRGIDASLFQLCPQPVCLG